MRLAVLDLGLDVLHLEVFEVRLHGTQLAGLRSWAESVRLAAALPEGPQLSDTSLLRALASVQRLLEDLARFDPTCPLVAIGSAALRGAAGGPAFCDEIQSRHGVSVELLSCEREARLSYRGATSCVRASGRLAVVDLGASSLQLATGSGPGASDLVYSVPLGVLGLRDVYLNPSRGLDRTARERVAATVRFSAADAARAVWDRRPERLIFTSGTALALGAVADELGIRPPDSNELDLGALARLADVLAQFRPIELPALGVEEARSDTIAVGAVVLHTLMELLGAESSVISRRGRREGAALQALACSDQAPAPDRVHSAVT
jgi:exopolyphosphatase/guanosine-5'-triphosphate,3'-diphosphate pyrophosphatase